MDKFRHKLRKYCSEEHEFRKRMGFHEKNKKQKIIIYTAIFGGKDKLQPISKKSPGCDYHCFTDENIKEDGWKIIKGVPKFLKDKHPRYISRYFKINPHLILPKEYNYTLWLDGNINPKFDIYKLAEIVLKDHDIAISRHPERCCIYQEANICKILNLDAKEIIDEQMKRYRKEGFPEKIGLCENFVIFRKNNKRIRKFNELWWHQLSIGSVRDQLSLNYILYKQKINWHELPNARFDNKYYKYNRHIIDVL